VEPMRRISFLGRYVWLRVMDGACWMCGHKLVNFPKGRFCRRCYRVEEVDFRRRTCAIGWWIRRLRRQ